MTDPAKELIELLDVERLEKDLFRGVGAGGETTARIYGGQVIAQALMAAYRTVEQRPCHSLHGYFIRPGDPSIPVIYQVDRARDGGSFTTRRVVAIQHGKQILNISASFHADEEGWNHQHSMPEAPNPAGLRSRREIQESVAHRVPEARREDFLRPRPIEIREVDPQDYFEPEVKSDVNALWFRMPGAIGTDPSMQQCLMAYASDMNLLGSSLRPHGLSFFNRAAMTASLDHTMWFHHPIAFEKWHYYTMDAPFTGGARGFNRGSIYTEEGVLVASVAQEGLVRPLRKDAE
ncbi:MAG: acyl-CoA thioesterase II [Pseudomonadota bacterium]